MINYIWSAMVLFAFFSAIFYGNMPSLSSAIISSGAEAVELCIKLLGMLCLWGGLMNIAEKSGLTKLICRILSPIFSFLFPDIKKNSPTLRAISMNITANILGLGNAATPLGIEAMRRLQDENPSLLIASDSMIRFVVLNTAALHIVPTTVATLRQSFGASQPLDIMSASWLASFITLCVGIALTKGFEKRKCKK